MMSWHGNAFILLALSEDNSNTPVTDGSPHKRPVMRIDYVFCMNKLLNKQSIWFWDAITSMWRHCNATNPFDGVYCIWWY